MCCDLFPLSVLEIALTCLHCTKGKPLQGLVLCIYMRFSGIGTEWDFVNTNRKYVNGVTTLLLMFIFGTSIQPQLSVG